MTTGWTGSEVAVLPPKFNLVKIVKTAAATSSSLLLCSSFFCLGMATLKSSAYSSSSITTLIGDEEFVLLYDMFPSKNPSFPYHEYARFDLDNMSEADCKADFRFEKKDLPVLAEALQIPPSFKLNQGTIVDGMKGLCMLLRRLAHPCRFGDMVPRFGCPVPVICMATNHVIDFI